MHVSGQAEAHMECLTPREKQVLTIVGQGKTTKEIAEVLGVSSATVSNHRKHICRKLGIHSTAELVAFAARLLNGLPQNQ